MTTVVPFGALLLLAAFSDICVATRFITEVEIENGTCTCTAHAEAKIFRPTMKVNGTHDGLQITVDHGPFQGYVFVKGPGGACNKTLTTVSTSTILRFLYSECGIEDKGSIILILRNDPALDDYRANHHVYEYEGKSFHVWERMESGTLTQILYQAKSRIRFDRNVNGHINKAVVEVKPASLYGTIVKSCSIRIVYSRTFLSDPKGTVKTKGAVITTHEVTDENGCYYEPHKVNDVHMSKWFVDRETDLLTATLNTTALPLEAKFSVEHCTIETCIGRCETQQRKLGKTRNANRNVINFSLSVHKTVLLDGAVPRLKQLKDKEDDT